MKALLVAAAVAILSLACASNSGPEGSGEPDATLRFTGASAAGVGGYAWGTGVLTFHGEEYKFRVTGLTHGDIGGGTIDAVGKVYHLKRIEDFPGTYTGVATAIAVGGGIGLANGTNQSGVYVQLTSTTQGVRLKAGPAGVTVTLEP